jgi:hypothetical protein
MQGPPGGDPGTSRPFRAGSAVTRLLPGRHALAGDPGGRAWVNEAVGVMLVHLRRQSPYVVAGLLLAALLALTSVFR